MRQLSLIPLLLLTLLSTGPAIAKKADKAIKNAPENDLQLAEVVKTPAEFTGAQVRWGGSILSTKKHDDTVRVEILQRPLNRKGKPVANKHSDGRFVAYIPASEYKAKRHVPGRLITIAGVLNNQETTQISPQLQLTVPVVSANKLHTWKGTSRNTRYVYNRRYFHRPHFGYGVGFHRSKFGFHGGFRHGFRGFHGGFRHGFGFHRY